jgi:hypothetical protein
MMPRLFRTLVFTALLGTRALDAQTSGTARSPAASGISPVATLLPGDTRWAAGAPIGHRQPRLKDVPSEDPEALATVGEEDRSVDHKLVICRGC